MRTVPDPTIPPPVAPLVAPSLDGGLGAGTEAAYLAQGGAVQRAVHDASIRDWTQGMDLTTDPGAALRFQEQDRVAFDYETAMQPILAARRDAMVAARQGEVEAVRQAAREASRMHTMTQTGADIMQLVSGAQLERPETLANALALREDARTQEAAANAEATTGRADDLYRTSLQQLGEDQRIAEANAGIAGRQYTRDMDVRSNYMTAQGAADEARVFNQTSEQEARARAAAAASGQRTEAENNRRARQAEALAQRAAARQDAQLALQRAAESRAAAEGAERMRLARNADRRAGQAAIPARATAYDISALGESLATWQGMLASTKDDKARREIQGTIDELRSAIIENEQAGGVNNYRDPALVPRGAPPRVPALGEFLDDAYGTRGGIDPNAVDYTNPAVVSRLRAGGMSDADIARLR